MNEDRKPNIKMQKNQGSHPPQADLAMLIFDL
jgi:hypothetical protein